jgi:uncharacterized RDD family membrane protein YckC
VSEHEISPVPREARPYQGAPAGIVTRVIANTIDGAVVGAVLGAGYLGWSALLFLIDPRSFEFPAVSFLFSFTAATIVALVYLWIAWWLAARTYGGHVMGLRVHGRHGKRLGPLRSLARSAFCVFFPIGLLWCVVSPKRRSVQDVFLWTTVVYDWRPRPEDGTLEEVSPPGGR